MGARTASGLRPTVVLLLACASVVTPAETPPQTYRYHPKYRAPASLESTLLHLDPGHDAFPEEKVAQELDGRLKELGALLRAQPPRAAEAVNTLAAPEFRGARLTPTDEVSMGHSPQLEVFRARGMPSELALDPGALRRELAALVADFESVETAELLITGVELERAPEAQVVRTTVRFDIAGPAKGGGRADRLGHWRMRWRRGADGAWRLLEWSTLDHLRSRVRAPVFTEVSEQAFGGNPSFRQQLVPALDAWASRLDAVFMPRGMGHHGVSAGDFDGDGLDDLYVSQPEGLPKRLFRNKGDGTFEDATEAAGLAVLDHTSQSLFADTDNDGDEDLILLARSGPMLFLSDGKGHFKRDADAFQFQRPLQGALTSAALADYDRDGFLDLYLCTYGYFIGVSEDKAGPPTPYHDAANGSPDALLRNDGHGRFVEVTAAVGLENSDRFSFAAAWADYDEDGWPDLLVANDFGRKNLYHNEAAADGQRRFRDVAAEAGVEDYGAGMSAAFLDYDNDGRLDIYTGNMWSATGQRVTAAPGFKPDATPEIRDIYRRHVRGNALFRNRGDGTFEDVTLAARAEMGRWAWSSDAFDFDSDGWQDLYVANGMFTRSDDESGVDVDSFFWRRVVAESPLTWKPGTPYDDGWRATNRLLVGTGTQAQHERNVLLRNNGQGGFDEVSGSVGLDLDQDGRSFAVLDYDRDGDPDLVLLAPRSSPQLRLFRNDYAARSAALAVRLVGRGSNRDAVGARVTVETDQVRVTRIVQAGSGFISQHSKELLFGLGRSQAIGKVTVVWPRGSTQTFSEVPLNHRVWIEEGSEAVRSEPFAKASLPSASGAAPPKPPSEPASSGAWLYEPFPAPDFALKDLAGQDRSLSAGAGQPAVILFWATWAPPSRLALDELDRHRQAFAAAGVSILTVAVDPPADEVKVRTAALGKGVPVLVASEEVAGTYSVVSRYLFDRREDLRLPTVFLLDAAGEIVKAYREEVAASRILEDVPKITVSSAERLARAVPFAGTFYSRPGARNYFQYGLELSEQGFDAPAVPAFERVAKVDPSAITFYNLGTLYLRRGNPLGARAAFERALEMQPDYAEASNSLGALLAQSGEVPAAMERFRAALRVKPDFADALNNLGFALFQTGQPAPAFELYEKALALQPGFPEALNNLGIFFGRQGDLDRARTYFQQAVEKRSSYGEAANNLALVLNAQGDGEGAITVLQKALEENPAFEMTYVTLSRIYLRTGQRREAVQVLEKLLQRNPKSALGLEILRQAQTGN